MQMIVVELARDVHGGMDGGPAGSAAAGLRATIPDIAPLPGAARRNRRPPWIGPNVMDAIVVGGVYRMLVPQSHGGLELSIPDVLPLIETLSAVDCSVGCLTMLAATS
jgi:indole-3-acetate monooxygenase